MIIVDTINNYFINKLSELDCSPITRAYITGVFNDFKYSHNDLSQSSLTLTLMEARAKSSFKEYQKLADWIFFCSSLYPEHLKHASSDYYNSLAQISYFTCYRLLNKQQKVYENMADEFVLLVEETRNIICGI